MPSLDSNTPFIPRETAQSLRAVAEHYWRLADQSPSDPQGYRERAMRAHTKALMIEHGCDGVV